MLTSYSANTGGIGVKKRLLSILTIVVLLVANTNFTKVETLYGATSKTNKKYWISIKKAEQVNSCQVTVDLETNLPVNAFLAVKVELAGQSDDDIYIGSDFVKYRIRETNKNITVNICKYTSPNNQALPKGKYDCVVAYYPRWSQNSEFRSKLPNEITATKSLYLNKEGKRPMSQRELHKKYR